MNHLSTLSSLLLLLAFQLVQAQDLDTCIQCHEQETRQWQTSLHARSMQPVSPATVLGNFEQARFVSAEIEAIFHSEGDQYLIDLTESGQQQTWSVRYTFGVYPLQQYLIDIGDGKLQALNIAWDSRTADVGGQRWFRLDAPEQQRPGTPLHWRGVYQNWNSMCADCHSTNLSKGYAPDLDNYDTRFDQINVSCSACHAQARTHAAAALEGQARPAGAALSAQGAWIPGSTEHKPRHTGSLSSSEQVETCGRCHALRTRLDQTPNGRINDTYSLNRLQSPLYFADGRVREEVFVLGSFLQSKMHRAGVVCSNCHNPHTAKPVAEGNALCSQCHAASSFDRTEHHRHQQDSAGAQCVNCHMPERTYMQVDPRREHNFTTPNPVTAQRADSPDPCLACHKNESRDWSIQQVSSLWPKHRERSDWFEIQQAQLPAISRFIANSDGVPLYRASLLEQQAPALAQTSPMLIVQQLTSDDALLRESSWKAATNLPAEIVQPHAETGLTDQSISVRLAAFETLMLLQALPNVNTHVRNEYEAYLQQQADRPAGRTLRARYALLAGQPSAGEQDLNLALKMDNAYLPAYILLSDLLRSQQRFNDAIEVLNKGLQQLPESAQLWHLRGLTWLQLQRYDVALKDLQQASEQAPDNWLFGYRYGLALLRLGQIERASQVVQQLQKLAPGNAQLNALMVEIHNAKRQP